MLQECDEYRDFTTKYWTYFRMLEDDCFNLSRYVAFDKKNFKVFSNEIIRQLMSAAAEFDNICKKITGMSKEKTTITDYGKWFFQDNDTLKNATVYLRNTNIVLKPFEAWGETKNDVMPWWGAYNEVKHHRSDKYIEGNLENLLNAIAALYYLIRYHYIDIHRRNSDEEHQVFSIPPDQPRLFYTGGIMITELGPKKKTENK